MLYQSWCYNKQDNVFLYPIIYNANYVHDGFNFDLNLIAITAKALLI